MSGTNHITGGVVFTGIFASFWNVNIFAKPELLAATGFFAILPDVDHLKSPIGKLFYPLAKWLDRKYGHRTITHSLTVYIPAIVLILFLEKAFGTANYAMIFALAYFSHLLFDMLTKQGIPLFYPFKRNPCVIPGNPEMRLRSSDLKTEAACFAIFILLGITCQNLFANGFWNTYNRQFSDLKHLHQEAQMSETMLSVRYHFRTPGNREALGTGYLVSSTEKRAVLYDKQFVTISAEDRILSIEPRRTAQVLTTHEIFFSGITPDSLTKLLHGKPIVTVTLQSNTEFAYTKANKPETGKRAELEFVVNPVFTFATATPTAKTDTSGSRRKILQYELAKELTRQAQQRNEQTAIENRIRTITENIPNLELYEREKATQELKKLNSQFAAFPEIQDNAQKLRLQIEALNTKTLPIETEPIKLSGYINLLKL